MRHMDHRLILETLGFLITCVAMGMIWAPLGVLMLGVVLVLAANFVMVNEEEDAQ